jgi:hypothetical protein
LIFHENSSEKTTSQPHTVAWNAKMPGIKYEMAQKKVRMQQVEITLPPKEQEHARKGGANRSCMTAEHRRK